MNFGKLVLGTFAATVGASLMHQASAQWSTGGSTTITRKSHLDGLDLFCDLNAKSFAGDTIAPPDQLKIVTSPSESNPGGATSLTFQGQMFCAELEKNAPRSLSSAAVINGVQLVGKFKLEQQAPTVSPQSGLNFIPKDGSGVRTWLFEVPLNPEYPFPELLYHLVPANPTTANKFCHTGTDCKVLIGLELPADRTDYPARDVDGVDGDDLTDGQVFSFSTITSNGIEAPRNFYWGPCHSGTFDGTSRTVVVNASNTSHGGTGMPVTGFSISQGQRIAVTVKQNDLWNSGNDLFGWSNADGLTGAIFAVAGDESGATAGTPIGTTSFLPADQGRQLWKFSESSGQWESVAQAAVGTLVGTLNNDSRNFYIFGTAFDGPSPSFNGQTGTLKLYSWDQTATGNTNSVTVTVATGSIQCRVDDLAALTASGDVRGMRSVQSEGFPRLNVASGTDGGGFPFAVLGCKQPGFEISFANNGSPISLNPSRVLVNGQPVAIDSFQVTDTVKNKDCDVGGANRDLNLKLNRQQFIQAIAPGGVCTNGSLEYRVELGNAIGGWFIGRDTVDVNNCTNP